MTARLPASGTFVTGRLETRQHFFDEAWVFSSVSPEELGLNSQTWQLPRPWESWVPSENGWANGTAAIQSLKMDVLGHLGHAVQRCNQAPSCRKLPALEWKLNQTVF